MTSGIVGGGRSEGWRSGATRPWRTHRQFRRCSPRFV